MRIFLAGVSTSNLSPMYKDYVARLRAGEDATSAHIQSIAGFLRLPAEKVKAADCPRWEELNVLESYYYAVRNEKLMHLIPRAKNFLLDSGAFSFMQGTGAKCDWDRYTNEYADYIVENDVKYYLELDIDNLVGLREVERLRALLERRVGRKCIPVWHVERGKPYYLDMVKEYPYVALGSIAKVVPGKRKILPKYFGWFIATAKENGSRVHALGYTPNDLHGTPFFSVDSTNWIYGNMTGAVHLFDPQRGCMTSINKPEGARLKNREVCVHNFSEWQKYINYAEKYL